MSRNGTAVHDATQADYLRMEQVLRDAGHSVRFRFLEAEINGEKSYMVGNRKVTIRGRSDGRIGLLDDDGNVVQEIGWELKTKDKRTNMNKVLKEGVQLGHRKQAVAYALIFGITKWIFEYQSMQKPEWKDVDPEKPDIKHFYVQVDPDEARQLLLRLAKVVEQIETKTLPAPELDKCGFCAFKTQCRLDGGYQG
jgi:CRISPR/Cas system-associated exonuclease Cas4 (RecB family)